MAAIGWWKTSRTLDEVYAFWRCGRESGRLGIVKQYDYESAAAAKSAYLKAESVLLAAGKIERARYLTDHGMSDAEIARAIKLYEKSGAAYVEVSKLDRWSIFKAKAGLVPVFDGSSVDRSGDD